MGPFQRIFPSLRFNAHNSRSPLPSAVPMFKKIISFQMIGVDPLRPGIGNFQAMFSSVDHFRGSPRSVLMPFMAGPRQAGQFSAESVAIAMEPKNPAVITRLSTRDLLDIRTS